MFAERYANSIGYLLTHAGPVIRYRLKRDILHSLTESEAMQLQQEIAQLPYYQIVQRYVKPNGYIGSGMHSWDNWRGERLHETPLQDGERAARLLSYYCVPKDAPIVADFVAAMRNENVLREEFSYIPPEIPRFENRFVGLNNGNSLMAMMYAMQAMLGYGDDYADLREFQQICLRGFDHLRTAESFESITKYDASAKRRYNYRYIESDEYFPDVFTLAMLAYTRSWRSEENVDMLAKALNHINEIMKPEYNMHVRIAGKFYAPCFAMIHPIRAFDPSLIDSINYRRPLTEIAMLGVGEQVEVIRRSADAVRAALDSDGILRMDFSVPHNKRYSPKKIEYTGSYGDVRLEADYKSKHGLLCDLTFWAIEFLYLVEGDE